MPNAQQMAIMKKQQLQAHLNMNKHDAVSTITISLSTLCSITFLRNDNTFGLKLNAKSGVCRNFAMKYFTAVIHYFETLTLPVTTPLQIQVFVDYAVYYVARFDGIGRLSEE